MDVYGITYFNFKRIMEDIKPIITKVKEELKNSYQQELVSLILFGSQARGEANQDSDIDILVILNRPVNPVIEIKRNIDKLTELSLENNKEINCFYVSQEQFKIKQNPLLKTIDKEGILL